MIKILFLITILLSANVFGSADPSNKQCFGNVCVNDFIEIDGKECILKSEWALLCEGDSVSIYDFTPGKVAKIYPSTRTAKILKVEYFQNDPSTVDIDKVGANICGYKTNDGRVIIRLKDVVPYGSDKRRGDVERVFDNKKIGVTHEPYGYGPSYSIAQLNESNLSKEFVKELDTAVPISFQDPLCSLK